jgi:hypothetical protein
VIPLGSGAAHTFTPSAGSFADFLRFKLGDGATGALASVVSPQLSNSFNINNLVGPLYDGNFNSGHLPVVPPPSIGSTLTAGSTNVSFGPLNSGQFYAFVYTGTATGIAGGSYTAAVAAVPEAHEWAMMLSGLGFVGFVVSRRRRAAAAAA